MKSKAALTAVALCLCLGLCAACSDKEEETVVELDRAGESIQKAYDGTTNALKDVVEGVNDAVY